MAQYPDTVAVFTNKRDLTDVVFAADMNAVQDEVVAIQNALGSAPQGASATVKARLSAIESGKTDVGHTHSTANVTSGTLGVARGGTGFSSYTGLNYVRAAAGGTALEQRTPTQVRTDISAADAAHGHEGTYAPDSAREQFQTFNREGALTTFVGTGRLPFPYAVEIVNIYATVTTAPSGADILIDVNKNGTSILTGSVTIAAGTNTSGFVVPTTTAFAAEDYLTIDIDQVGTAEEGQDLTVVITYRRT